MLPRAFQGADRIGTGLLAASLESAVNDTLCGGLLAVLEDLVDEHGYLLGVVYRVLDYRTLRAAFLRIVYYCPFFAP